VKPKSAPRTTRPTISDAAIFEAATTLDALRTAWARVQSNAGAAGGDRVTIAEFAADAPVRLGRLRAALRDGSYSPVKLRRVDIPKNDGTTRTLAIPGIVDRVAQTAFAQVLAPHLDREFEDSSFGYRAGRSVQDAVRRVSELRALGLVHVVDADIAAFFDSVPHDRLLARLAESMDEGPATGLIALWLEHAGANGRGLAQGSPLSPLLANLFLDRLDEAFAGRGARIVRFADDFVILCASHTDAAATLARVRGLLAAQGLDLRPDKTRITSFDQGFRFLGTLFVRSLAMISPEPPPEDAVAALRRLAGDDAAEAARADQDAAAEETARDAGLDPVQRVLHIVSPDRRLHRRNQAFSIEAGSAAPGAPPAWREILALPHQMVDRIELGAEATATPAALRHALATATPLAFIDGHGETLGWVSPGLAPHAARHLAQARHALDPGLRRDLACRLVEGRLRNHRALLRRLNRDRRHPETIKALVGLNRLIAQLATAPDAASVMGFEGQAAALFWPAFGAMLDHGFAFRHRRREAADAPNLLLNVAAALLLRDAAIAVTRAGLHPGIAFLHATEDHRDSLALDLAEIFRAPLAESVVVQAVNNRAISAADFDRLSDGTVRLKAEGYRTIVRVYEQAAARPVASLRDGRRRTWRGIMLDQAQALAAHVEGRGSFSPQTLDY
jgi:CRISPR-associated protein Cas1